MCIQTSLELIKTIGKTDTFWKTVPCINIPGCKRVFAQVIVGDLYFQPFWVSSGTGFIRRSEELALVQLVHVDEVSPETARFVTGDVQALIALLL